MWGGVHNRMGGVHNRLQVCGGGGDPQQTTGMCVCGGGIHYRLHCVCVGGGGPQQTTGVCVLGGP